jgi:L-rhamnose isomerase
LITSTRVSIGEGNVAKALLLALVAPSSRLKRPEVEGDFTSRLALIEDTKTLPFGPVWDYYCYKMNVPVGNVWLSEVQHYEQTVLPART